MPRFFINHPFSGIPFVFTRVLFVFTSVHSCSDSCGVLDQITEYKHMYILCDQSSAGVLLNTVNYSSLVEYDFGYFKFLNFLIW